MSNFSSSLLVLCLFLFTSCAVNTQFSSKWQNTNSLHSTIYSSTPADYSKIEDGISLKVFNNDQYLDIILETNSARTLRKIYNLGLSIWIDPDGKLKNTFAVHYPMPGDIIYSREHFENYLRRFNNIEFKEELIDRFQKYEVLDTRKNESFTHSTLQNEEDYQVKLSSSTQVLFSYHMRIAMDKIFLQNYNKEKVISIGIANVNEANDEYFSAMSSKEYIKKRMNKLKAGVDQSPEELTEWWVDFKLASQN